jgi:formylglycine-generating enzyme required for sulfatase activity
VAHDIFISYSSKNKTIADAVCATLEAAGLRCWIAPRDVNPGAVWAASIAEAIESSSIMVLIFSRHVNNSSHVMSELELAVNSGLVILPFRIEDIEPSSAIGFFVRTSHWLDALTEPMEQHLDRLANSVKIIMQTKDKPVGNGASVAHEPHSPIAPRPGRIVPSGQEQNYLAAVRASNAAHVMRDRVAGFGQSLSQAIAAADRRETTILEKIIAFFRDHVISAREFLDVEIDIRSGDVMLADGQYAAALETFERVQRNLRQVKTRLELEDSRVRAQTTLGELRDAFEGNGLRASDALLTARQIFEDAQQALQDERYEEAAAGLKAAHTASRTVGDEMPGLLAGKQKADVEEELRRLGEHCDSADLPLPSALEAIRALLLSGKTRLSENDVRGAAADFESASHSLSDAWTEARDSETHKQSAADLWNKAAGLNAEIRELSESNELPRPEDAARAEQALESGKRLLEKREFLAAVGELQNTVRNLGRVVLSMRSIAEAKRAAIVAQQSASSVVDALAQLCSPAVLARIEEAQKAIGTVRRGEAMLRQGEYESAAAAFKKAEEALKMQLEHGRLLNMASELERSAVESRKKTARYYSKYNVNTPSGFHEAENQLSSAKSKLLQQQDLEETIEQLRRAERGFRESLEEIEKAEWVFQIEQSVDAARRRIAGEIEETGLVPRDKFLAGVSMLEKGRKQLHIRGWDDAATAFRKAEELFRQADEEIAGSLPLLRSTRAIEEELQEIIKVWKARAQAWGQNTSLPTRSNKLIEKAHSLEEKGNYHDASASYHAAIERIRAELAKPSRAPEGWEVIDSTPSGTGWAMEVMDPRSGIKFRLIEAGRFLMGSPETEQPDDTWCEEDFCNHPAGKGVANEAGVSFLSQFWTRIRGIGRVGVMGGISGGREPSTQDSSDARSTSVRVRENEHPQHEVVIEEPFYIAVVPTTVAQWQRKPPTHRAATGRLAQLDMDARQYDDPPKDPSGIPQTRIDWNEAWAYCRHFDYRLPTEAEWEYACRAGSTSRRYGKLNDIAWHRGNSAGRIHEAGKKQPNAWGLYDMLGNISEWCSDAYDKDAYRKHARSDPFVSDGQLQVRRGGSYSEPSAAIRAAFRRSSPAKDKRPDLGFRCVCPTRGTPYEA